MSYAIVYSSKTGNTKILADTLHDCLPQEDCCYFGSPNPAAMEADTLYVGFWTDKGKADESTSDFLKQLHGKNIFLFGTAGFGGSKEYFDKILKKAEHSPLDKSIWMAFLASLMGWKFSNVMKCSGTGAKCR